jgi:hypothetical protein
MTPASSVITSTTFPGKNQTQIRRRFFPPLKCRFFHFLYLFVLGILGPLLSGCAPKAFRFVDKSICHFKISYQMFLFSLFTVLALHCIQQSLKGKVSRDEQIFERLLIKVRTFCIKALWNRQRTLRSTRTSFILECFLFKGIFFHKGWFESFSCSTGSNRTEINLSLPTC